MLCFPERFDKCMLFRKRKTEWQFIPNEFLFFITLTVVTSGISKPCVCVKMIDSSDTTYSREILYGA